MIVNKLIRFLTSLLITSFLINGFLLHDEIPHFFRDDRAFLIIGGREAGAFRTRFDRIRIIFAKRPCFPPPIYKIQYCHSEWSQPERSEGWRNEESPSAM